MMMLKGTDMSDIIIDPNFVGKVQSESVPPTIEGVEIMPVKANVDDRQNLMVYLKASDPIYAGFSQSYVTITQRGVVKAWHYHLHQTDIWFVASGKIKVGLFDARKDSSTCGVANTILMGGGNNITLKIPPGVFHGYLSLCEECVLINTTNQPYNPKDEYRAEWDDPRFGYVWDVENR